MSAVTEGIKRRQAGELPEGDGIYLRLTGQGPWQEAQLVAVAASVG